jgi:iron complex transport system substrate-binding protein
MEILKRSLLQLLFFFLCLQLQAAAPERVISLAPSLTSAVLELEAGELLVGVTDFCSLPTNSSAIAKIGGYQDPNVEVILRLKPNLVIALPEHQHSVRTLDRLGVKTLTLANTNIDDIEKTMRTLAEALERPAQLELWQQKAQQAKTQAAQKAEAVRVLLVVSHESKQKTINQVYVAGPASFLNELLELAGGVNAVSIKQPVYPKLSQEALIKMAPDRVINLVPQAELSDELKAAQFEAWSNIPHFSAKVQFLTHESVLQAGPAYPEILAAMRRLMDQP